MALWLGEDPFAVPLACFAIRPSPEGSPEVYVDGTGQTFRGWWRREDSWGDHMVAAPAPQAPADGAIRSPLQANSPWSLAGSVSF